MNENEEIRKKLLKKPVRDISINEAVRVGENAIEEMKKIGGFSTRYIVRAADILAEIFSNNKTVTIMSFPANIVATGIRGLIVDMVRHGLIDAIITTGGTFDHDIARGLGKNYYVGDFELDDIMLRKLEIHRLGNILVPFENYGPPIEEFTHEMLEDLASKKSRWSPSELAYEAGLRLPEGTSILGAAARKGIPIFSPGIVDGAFGTAIYTFNDIQRGRVKGKEVIVDVVADMRKLSEIVLSAEKLGGIMLGGGISKHHLIWWAQFRGGLDYAVAITSAPEWDGSLSGARTREAISWGKIRPEARHVTVPGDLTTVFPLILGYAIRKAGYA